MQADLGVPVYQTLNSSLGTFYMPLPDESALPRIKIEPTHVVHSLAPADLAAMRERIDAVLNNERNRSPGVQTDAVMAALFGSSPHGALFVPTTAAFEPTDVHVWEVCESVYANGCAGIVQYSVERGTNDDVEVAATCWDYGLAGLIADALNGGYEMNQGVLS